MHTLARSDVRQRKDGPTNTVVLEYVGRKLCFDSYLYGFPPGTFFYVELADVPYPEHIEELASASGIDVDVLPDAELLRRSIADALCAGAMVDAPEYLADLAEPETEWSRWDRIELERRHRIAEARVKELGRVLETEVKRRVACLRAAGVEMTPPTVEFMEPPPPPPPLAIVTDARPPAPSVPAPAPAEVVEEIDDEDDEIEDEEQLTPRSRTVKRACVAVDAAREIELPQRLPSGARRRLRRMPSGSYVAYGEALDVRVDLCGAMTDARALARKDKHSTVIQWDGEWPVVVRRYGKGGRTVYKVESALRRYTREHRMKTAWQRFKAAVEKAFSEGEAA